MNSPIGNLDLEAAPKEEFEDQLQDDEEDIGSWQCMYAIEGHLNFNNEKSFNDCHDKEEFEDLLEDDEENIGSCKCMHAIEGDPKINNKISFYDCHEKEEFEDVLEGNVLEGIF